MLLKIYPSQLLSENNDTANKGEEEGDLKILHLVRKNEERPTALHTTHV